MFRYILIGFGLFTIFPIILQAQSGQNSTNCTTKVVNPISKSVYSIKEPATILIIDRDGDGLTDDYEHDGVAEDIDGDGILNCDDLDSDGDGVTDREDECWSVSGNPPTGCPEEPKDREVVWLHGWKGTDLSGMHIPAEYVKGLYQVNQNTDIPNYNSTQGSLEDAADAVSGFLKSNFDEEGNTERNFVIAHSQGGLVMRQMGELFNEDGYPLYNGLITLSTPHQGAEVADVIVNQPERIQAVLDDACSSLAAGPAFEQLEEQLGSGLWQGIAKTLIGIGVLGDGIDNVCEFGTGPFLDLGLNEFILEGIEEDLTTNSASTIPPMPTANRAAFYSWESNVDETFTARFFGALMPGSTPQEYPLFEADASDEVGIRQFTDLTDWYQSREIYWDERAPGWGWICPLWAIERELRYDRNRDAFREGLRFLDDLNSSYRNLIGAETIEVEAEESCTCIINNGPSTQFSFPIDCDEDPGICDDIETQTRFVSNYLHKQADGFILTESSMAAPGVNHEVQVMEGSNHMQLKNDSNMEEAIGKIFDDGLGQDYFKTNRK